MAILSNGKFYGFLCSAKETGQKLANGAKEYMENFVSGFAGHGWKIWEYVKGKWMLEIDSIRVRGQFTVFEMLISKVRAIIGAQAITQGCGKIKSVELSEDGAAYLIALEDKEMSFMEHDFIRCQEFTGEKRTYHVEIESVSDGVIRIPVSEFDEDEGGLIQNPPMPGDDIVQFGNSSHDEKYVGRHSAIYMHADEGVPPAIDVLDGIYSKELSNCLKVRMGGDIPGSGGLKGLYCVNGMIKGVSNEGTVVYQINPDGSGFLANGGIKWDVDGRPGFSGTILLKVDENHVWEVDENCIQYVGDKTGKRIEINPNNQSMKIYDAENVIATILDGNKYKTIQDVFGNNVPNIEFINLPCVNTVVATAKENPITRVKEVDITNSIYIKSTAMVNLSFNYKCYNQFDPSVINSNAHSVIVIMVCTYSDPELTQIVNQETIHTLLYPFSGNYNGQNFINNVVFGEGYIKIRAQLKCFAYGGGNGASVELSNMSYNLVTDRYIARFFANGITLGSAQNNIFSVLNNKNVLDESENVLIMDAQNSKFGFGFDFENIFVKRNGRFGMMSSIICCGRAYTTNAGAYLTNYKSSFDGNYPTLTRLNVGLCQFTYPLSWLDEDITYKTCYVMLTGIGQSLGALGNDGPMKATLHTFLNNGFVVSLSDDATTNDGEFYFEIKRF